VGRKPLYISTGRGVTDPLTGAGFSVTNIFSYLLETRPMKFTLLPAAFLGIPRVRIKNCINLLGWRQAWSAMGRLRRKRTSLKTIPKRVHNKFWTCMRCTSKIPREQRDTHLTTCQLWRCPHCSKTKILRRNRDIHLAGECKSWKCPRWRRSISRVQKAVHYSNSGLGSVPTVYKLWFTINEIRI
jgi:DNA-directed RNA polymerase subunit RPC12/RpoP